jgi:hypothetical protein
MSDTNRSKFKTRETKNFKATKRVKSLGPVSLCLCGCLIEDGADLCIECETALEEFNGLTMEELLILESRLPDWKEEEAI